MSITSIVSVDLTGIATVKFKRTVQMSKWKAKRVLADDEEMQKMLLENKNIEVIEWNLVSGERKDFKNEELKVGASL